MPDLSTRTARRRLAPRHDEYWFRIARGRALGYRRSDKDKIGTWYVRAFSKGSYRKEAFATTDDVAPANRIDILSFAKRLSEQGPGAPAVGQPVQLT